MLMKDSLILTSGYQVKILWGVPHLHRFACSGRHLKALIDVVPVFLLVSGS
jgi:hypothetical protein